MKLTTFILATMATFVIATPMAAPKDTSNPNANEISARDDCDECNRLFDSCRGGIWCWLNPVGCEITCRRETCQQNGEMCHNKCGFEC